MKKYSILFGALLLIVSMFISCEQDETSIQELIPAQTEFSDNFGSTTTARFFGTVVNENNEVVEGVTISVGGMNTLTDENGVFTIQGASVYEKFAYIKATKAGYINGSRSLVPTSGVNQVKIMLLAENVVATINSGEQSEVSLSNGTQVNFEGDFVKADGVAYSGAVSVIMKHLDPMDENVSNMMPGMLFAEDASGSARVLETYGMLAVELKGTSGEKLQLADGAKAQISAPIPATMMSNAPQSIPLWHFDEENGYWKEEGAATLVNGKYVGEVSHFSFWNYDAQFPAVNLCMNIVYENGSPVANTHITLTHSNANYLFPTSHGYTNANGEVCGLVPQNEALVLQVFLQNCNQAIEITIGPFSTDESITITVPNDNEIYSVITGTFNDCNNNAIANGYIQFNHNAGVLYIPVSNGEINFTYAFCGTAGENFTAQGIDISGQQTTTIISGTLGTTVDLGVITSCGTFEDTDGDGVFDEFEDVNQDNNLENDDTDQDGIPNYNDTDDDGDGVPTADEDIDGDGDFTNDDSDGDGVVNYLDPYDITFYSATLDLCDDDLNGEESFDLTQLDSMVVGNQTDLLASYYATQADAENEQNVLSSPYIYATGYIFVRLDHNTLAYYTIGQAYLLVQNCTLGTPQDLIVCEDTQGSESSCYVNFDTQYTQILNGNSGTVNFYTTEVDAQTNANPINIANFCTVGFNQTIYTRAEVGNTVTFNSFVIFIQSLPILTIDSTTCDAGNATFTAVISYMLDIDEGAIYAQGASISVDSNNNTITLSGITSGNGIDLQVYGINCPYNPVILYIPSPTCN